MSSLLLSVEGEVCTAILLPALLAWFVAEGLFLAVADGLDAVAGDPELYKLVANPVSTVRSESHVVILRTALITMTGDYDFVARVGGQEVRIRFKSCGVLRPDIISVIVEKNVLDVMPEKFLV